MSTPTERRATEMAGQMRAPLPGLHPVLTWQMNLTLHKATGLAKYVSVVREPSDHFELHRQFSMLEPWAGVHLLAHEACEHAITDMGLLMGMPTRLYEPR